MGQQQTTFISKQAVTEYSTPQKVRKQTVLGNNSGRSSPARRDSNPPTPKNCSFKDYVDTLHIAVVGCGESGKATFLKQCKIALANLENSKAFSHEQLVFHKNILYNNLLLSMNMLCEISKKKFEEAVQQNDEVAKELFSLSFKAQTQHEILNAFTETYRTRLHTATDVSSFITSDILKIVYDLWENEPAIQAVYNIYRTEEHLLDSLGLFFTPQRIARMLDFSHFIPQYADLVIARKKTTGIVESLLGSKCGKTIHFSHCGGQRVERKKWSNVTEAADAIVFLVNLGEYNQNLYEDESKNRLQESLEVFSAMVNGNNVKNSVPILKPNQDLFLVFNKKDVFLSKIQFQDLSCCFDDLPFELKFERPPLKQLAHLLKKEGGMILSKVEQTIGLEKQRIHSSLQLKRQESLSTWKKQQMNLSDIPVDILFEICKYLNQKDLCILSSCNMELYNIATSDTVWRNLCLYYHKEMTEEMEHLVSIQFEEYVKIHSNKQSGTIQRKKYKYYFEKNGIHFQQSLQFIIQKFLQSVDEEEKRKKLENRIFVISSIDIKAVDETAHAIVRDAFQSKGERNYLSSNHASTSAEAESSIVSANH